MGIALRGYVFIAVDMSRLIDKLLSVLSVDSNYDQPVAVPITLQKEPSMPTAQPDLKPKEDAKPS